MIRVTSSNMRWSSLFLFATLAACGARSGLRVDGSAAGPGGSGGAGGGGSGGGGAGGAGGVGGVVELALGAEHSCLRTLEGRVYCWGANEHGQIAQPASVSGSVTPRQVALAAPALRIAAGTYHACAVLLDGSLWCWGRGRDGQIGDTGGADSFTPIPIALAPSTVTALSLGEAHSCVVREEPGHPGATYCWGRNTSGQLGIGAVDPGSATPLLLPMAFREIALGDFWTLGVAPTSLSPGLLHGWGDDASWELGFVGTGAASPTPAKLTVHGIASGKGQHACGLVSPTDSDTAAAFCWGNNTSGQLGWGTTSERELPGPVVGLPGGVDAVAPGYDHTCALVAGKVYCWGSNASGKLGGGTKQLASSIPAEVPGLSGIVAIGAGTLHTCAFRSPTEIYCWGANDFGQLGNGDTAMQPAYTPSPVVLP